MPPLRPEAPQPTVCASIRTTSVPCRARCSAVDSPVRPAPITATSARAGRSRRRKSPAGSAVSSQYDVSFTALTALQTEQRGQAAEVFGLGVLVKGSRGVVSPVDVDLVPDPELVTGNDVVPDVRRDVQDLVPFAVQLVEHV